MSNEYKNLQANTIICNIDDYELNQQITGQFLIGILIKYVMLKKICLLSPSWEQKDKRERRLFQSISTDVHGILQLIQYQQKRNTRFLSPVTRAVWRIVL